MSANTDSKQTTTDNNAGRSQGSGSSDNRNRNRNGSVKEGDNIKAHLGWRI
ncbi:hypothetical protein [Actinoallomurus sp. NPDC052274]|uniref:hypothetical protein n=1 Tax=Actinoallomurus sp. NPDC052274 TaxID=3155420 RepID=UPI00341BA1A3